MKIGWRSWKGPAEAGSPEKEAGARFARPGDDEVGHVGAARVEIFGSAVTEVELLGEALGSGVDRDGSARRAVEEMLQACGCAPTDLARASTVELQALLRTFVRMGAIGLLRGRRAPPPARVTVRTQPVEAPAPRPPPTRIREEAPEPPPPELPPEFSLPAAQAQVLRAAARTGRPFCEECERARQARRPPAPVVPPAPPLRFPAPAAQAQAQVLKDAARSGVPFCEECERARQARQAGARGGQGAGAAAAGGAA